MNERFKQVRISEKLSQEAFGKELGVTKSAISSIESGRYNLSEPLIKITCTRFNVSEDWLRNGNGEMHIVPDDDLFFEDIWTNIRRSNSDNADFIKRIVKAYWMLPPEKQAAIMEFIDNISDK